MSSLQEFLRFGGSLRGSLQGFLRFGSSLRRIREDHLRHMNPTPYKVSVSVDLHRYIHDLWARETPIVELA